ncbi:regulatory protein RecX [Microbacterium deminutum]|uniref:regulatory protein RecX n=1 Tax=Microbacterium deminutum TaxID=344164 RepID=UPI0031CF5B62
MTPLFGRHAGAPRTGQPAARTARTAHADRPGPSPWRSTGVEDDDGDARRAYDDDQCGATDRARASELQAAFGRLMKKLGRRGLSVAEATAALVADGVDRDAAEVHVAELESKRWIGDADLAEQLVYAAVTRKGQGRTAIAQTLAKRRIPREVAEAALAQLPDDERERALDFARTRARSLREVERGAALRRLAGQLARRGYSSAASLTAARQALDEASAG